MELTNTSTEGSLRLSIQNWSLEMELSQPNSNLRDFPGWNLIIVSWPDIFNFINLILFINLSLYLWFNFCSIFWGFGVCFKFLLNTDIVSCIFKETRIYSKSESLFLFFIIKNTMFKKLFLLYLNKLNQSILIKFNFIILNILKVLYILNNILYFQVCSIRFKFKLQADLFFWIKYWDHI